MHLSLDLHFLGQTVEFIFERAINEFIISFELDVFGFVWGQMFNRVYHYNREQEEKERVEKGIYTFTTMQEQ